MFAPVFAGVGFHGCVDFDDAHQMGHGEEVRLGSRSLLRKPTMNARTNFRFARAASWGLALVFAFACWFVVDSLLYKVRVQDVEMPDGSVFALYEDGAGAGDLAFSVCRLRGDASWWEARLRSGKRAPCEVLWNYSEAGHDTDGARIDVVSGRYLVMSRGGLYYGLYDIREDRSLSDVASPWHSFLESRSAATASGDKMPDDIAYRAWARGNIHGPIDRTLKGTPD